MVRSDLTLRFCRYTTEDIIQVPRSTADATTGRERRSTAFLNILFWLFPRFEGPLRSGCVLPTQMKQPGHFRNMVHVGSSKQFYYRAIVRGCIRGIMVGRLECAQSSRLRMITDVYIVINGDDSSYRAEYRLCTVYLRQRRRLVLSRNLLSSGRHGPMNASCLWGSSLRSNSAAVIYAIRGHYKSGPRHHELPRVVEISGSFQGFPSGWSSWRALVRATWQGRDVKHLGRCWSNGSWRSPTREGLVAVAACEQRYVLYFAVE
jgi:hypothetical protein